MDIFRENIDTEIKMIFSSSTISNGLINAISTGNW